MASFLPPDFGYVCGIAVATFVVDGYMASKVMSARKKYNVQYPKLYAEAGDKNGEAFNCVQRGHQNCIENLPKFTLFLLLGGLEHPLTSAICGAVYLAGKVVYFNGYSTGDPKKRVYGSFSYFGLFGLIGCTASLGLKCLGFI